MTKINVDTVLARSPYGARPVAYTVRVHSDEYKIVAEKIDRLTRQIKKDNRTLQKHIDQRQELINELHRIGR